MSISGTGATGDTNEEPIRYAVRFSPRADREGIDAALRLEEITESEEVARDWYVGMRAAAGTLATNPRRYPILTLESTRMGRDTRHMLYRRTAGSTAAYYLFYFVEDESEDGPRVTIFHIRHVSRRPMTPTEARELRL